MQMKKIILTLTLICFTGVLTYAQDLLNRVPSTATMVMKYSGENFGKMLPVKRLEGYDFIKNDIFKMLHIDKKTSLQNIGINFEQDIYQYVSLEDTCMSFVTLLPLKNEAQFLKFMQTNYAAKKKAGKKNGFSFLSLSDDSYIGWNKTTAVIVNTTYQNRANYWDNYYKTPSSDSTAVILVDSAISVVEAPVADTAIVQSDSASMEIELVPLDEEKEAREEMERKAEDSINNLKWELWQQQQDMIARKKQEAAAEKIMAAGFAQTVYSIKNDPGYNKIVDPASHASMWINTESILNQYSNFFARGAYGILNSYRSYRTDTTDDFKSAVNFYFEKDKLRMENRSYSASAKMSALAAAVMNSKQSNSLANYVNPDNIGYFSMSINSEAMANYYYVYLRKYLSNTLRMNEFADMVDVYIDLLEIVIDEKAIADLLPGNYIFVMHDMKPQIVNYTDYEYDDEFNRKEVKKTKKELSPSFTFALETRKDDFMKKLAALPLKYAEKGGFNYKEKDGYYELAFKEGDVPFSSLYFMVKEGKVVVTTSKEVIDMTKSNTGFATDENTRSSILNNNYSLNINSKRLVDKIATQVSADVNKKITDYLSKNLGNLKMESSLKDGMIQGTTTLNITGNHQNSLEFFFNMMDAINNIMEQDRQEREKKLY